MWNSKNLLRTMKGRIYGNVMHIVINIIIIILCYVHSQCISIIYKTIEWGMFCWILIHLLHIESYLLMHINLVWWMNCLHLNSTHNRRKIKIIMNCYITIGWLNSAFQSGFHFNCSQPLNWIVVFFCYFVYFVNLIIILFLLL